MSARATDPSPFAWAAAYAHLAARLPEIVARATPVVTGFAVCLDRTLDLHECAPAIARLGDDKAAAFLERILARVAAGRGGEILVDWPDGPAVLDPFTRADGSSIGGTSAQAAWTLAELGAPAILALGEAGADELAALHPGIRVAAGPNSLRSPADILPRDGKPAHYVLEYQAGQPLLGIVPPRSTRIIVRFADEGLQHDPHLAAWVSAHGQGLRAGLLASPNTVPPDRLPEALALLSDAAALWRRTGLGLVHLELGEYPWPGTRDTTIAALTPTITSMGLNRNELEALVGDKAGGSVVDQASWLADELGLARLVVHADDWALAITTDDPEIELDSLAAGCLVAASRAAAGRPVPRPACPEGAHFGAAPARMISSVSAWRSAVCVAAPYLAHPASTLGLGDSFTAGCLLVHAVPDHRPMLARDALSAVPVDNARSS